MSIEYNPVLSSAKADQILDESDFLSLHQIKETVLYKKSIRSNVLQYIGHRYEIEIVIIIIYIIY